MAKSSERMFVKIAISAKKELVCELVGKKAEEPRRLPAQRATTSYEMPKFTVQRAPQKDTCGNLPKHIRSKHPELLESVDDSTKPLQIEVMARSPRTPRRYDTKRVNHHWQKPPQTHEVPATTGDSCIQDDVDMMTDDESSDSVLPQFLRKHRLIWRLEPAHIATLHWK
ncbi:hypothetical protein MRX96_040191 [Rhipicephalus microplus]